MSIDLDYITKHNKFENKRSKLRTIIQAIIDNDHANGFSFKLKNDANVNENIINTIQYLKRNAK